VTAASRRWWYPLSCQRHPPSERKGRLSAARNRFFFGRVLASAEWSVC